MWRVCSAAWPPKNLSPQHHLRCVIPRFRCRLKKEGLMPNETDQILDASPVSKHLNTPPPSCSSISRNEAADYLGVSTRTFDRIQKDNAIPYVLIHKRRRYLVSDLDSYVRSNRSI